MRTELSRVETIHFDRNFQLSITVLRFLNRFFFFWGGDERHKNAGIYLYIILLTYCIYIYIRFSKNRELWRARNPVNNSVLATFGDWNCGIYVISLHLTAPHCVKKQPLCAFYLQFLNERCSSDVLHIFQPETQQTDWSKPSRLAPQKENRKFPKKFQFQLNIFEKQ